MYLLYIDESGTSAIPGNTSHFILAGISVPIWHWKDCDREVGNIKNQYHLENSEIHTAWILRKYLEQSRIQNFSSLNYTQRRQEVEKYRKKELLRLQKNNQSKHYKQTKKNYKKTTAYVHLTYDERKQLILQSAYQIGGSPDYLQNALIKYISTHREALKI